MVQVDSDWAKEQLKKQMNLEKKDVISKTEEHLQ